MRKCKILDFLVMWNEVNVFVRIEISVNIRNLKSGLKLDWIFEILQSGLKSVLIFETLLQSGLKSVWIFEVLQSGLKLFSLFES